MLHMDSDTDNKSQLEAFKQEVSFFYKAEESAWNIETRGKVVL